MNYSIKENLISLVKVGNLILLNAKLRKWKEYFRNTKEHNAHKIFIDDLPEVFMSFLDNKKYTINSSLGEEILL